MLLLTLLLSMLATATAAADCPTHCICSSHLKTIRCSHQHLTDVPEGIPTTATQLQLGYNDITSIRTYAFYNLTSLRTLSLKSNTLSSLQPGTFYSLGKLDSLFLTNNKLVSIGTSVWKGLVSLRYLYISQNQLTSIPDPNYLPILSKLILDYNHISSVNLSLSFTNLTTLSSLVLNNNPIEYLTVQGLQPLRHIGIRKLNVGVCKLQDAESGVFSGMTSLRSLLVSYNPRLSNSASENIVRSLAGSQLNSLDMSGSLQLQDSLPAHFFSGLNSLIHLLLRRTKLYILHNDTFGSLAKLQTLDMSEGELLHCEHTAFSNLSSLHTLLLNNNQLDGIPANLPSTLTKIDLGHNPRIVNVQDNTFVSNSNLESLSLTNCGLLRLGKQSFEGLSRLRVLTLSHNQLGSTNIGLHLFEPMPGLRSLDISHNRLTDLLPQHRLFAYAQQLTALDMSGNSLHRFALQLFDNLTSLQQLQLNGNSLTKMVADDQQGAVFQNLRSLQLLDLSHSGVSTMPSALFANLRALQRLDLHANLISHWGEGLFDNLTHLQLLNLSDNRLTVVNRSSLEVLDSRGHVLQLDMAINPYDCYCDLIWFRRWLDITNVTVTSTKSYQCASPLSMQHVPLLAFNPNDLWLRCPPPLLLLCGIGAAIMLIVGVPIGIVLYRCRWQIRLCIYRRRRRQRGHQSGYGELSTSHRYALMVSYAEADGDWVQEHMLEKLTSLSVPEDLIFTQDKDIDVLGMSHMDILTETLDAMKISCKVVLVITLDYLRSRQRKAEMEEAIDWLVEENAFDERLSLLFLNPGDDETEIQYALPPLLKHNHFKGLLLKWKENDSASQELCWDRLVDSLEEGIEQINLDRPESSERNHIEGSERDHIDGSERDHIEVSERDRIERSESDL